MLQTLRKSLTKLELSGWVASSLVLHPSDWEAVELALSSTNAVEHLSLPYDPATRRLFGVPVVTTVSEAAGVAHALARDTVVIDTDNHGVGVQWLDDKGFVLTGASGGSDQAQWRHALGHPLATSCPGIFAVGDVRSGSVKRVASGVGECSIVVASVHQALINS